MKKFKILSMTLLLLIIASCKTTRQDASAVILPPKPQRQELTTPESLKDYAQIINYYEHLVQEWEQWGDTVSLMVEN